MNKLSSKARLYLSAVELSLVEVWLALTLALCAAMWAIAMF